MLDAFAVIKRKKKFAGIASTGPPRVAGGRTSVLAYKMVAHGVRK